MFKTILLMCALVAFAAAKPGVIAPVAYSAYNGPVAAAYSAPVAYLPYAAYTAPVAYSAYSAYSAPVAYASPYSAYYVR